MYCRLLRLVKESEVSFIPLNKTSNSTATLRINEMTRRSATSLIHSSTVGLLPAKEQIALTTKTADSSLTPRYSKPTYPDLRRTQLDQSITFCLAFRSSQFRSWKLTDCSTTVCSLALPLLANSRTAATERIRPKLSAPFQLLCPAINSTPCSLEH